MPYGQPFYNYAVAPYNGQNSGYYAQQQQYGNLYGQPQNAPQNANGGFTGQYQAQQPPVMPQSQQVQQQQTMANQAPAPQGFPIRELRFVTSEEAKAYIVMPNSNALLLDTVNGMAYLKTADNLGQSVTENFKFYKVNADGTPIQQAKNEKPAQVDFVPLGDFQQLVTQVGTLSEQIEILQKKLATKQVRAEKVKEIDNAE